MAIRPIDTVRLVEFSPAVVLCLHLPHILVNLDGAVLSSAHHSVAIHIYPETDPLVGLLDALYDLLGDHIPHHDIPVLTCRHNKWLPPTAVSVVVLCILAVGHNAKTSAYREPAVLVALVCLLDCSRHVVPKSDAIIEVEGEYKAAVRAKANIGDGGVVLVDERSETLAGGCIPYSTVFVQRLAGVKP